MWLMTPEGFYCVVAFYNKETGKVDPDFIVLRTRREEHLRTIIDRFQLTEPLLVTPDRDYRYRVVLPRPTWYRIVSELADVQYTNFKASVPDTVLPSSILHRIWAICRELQQ
jgi:hypothetical protein